MCKPVTATIATVARAKDITIKTDHFDGPAEVSGDPERLQQVFWNLLANAIKFSDRGGRITVALQMSASRLIITVTDNGHGIDSLFVPHVFEASRMHVA